MIDAGLPGPGPSSTFSETLAALRTAVQCHDTDRAKRRLSDAIVRGAAAGLAVRGGLHLVSYVAGILLKSKRRKGSTSDGRPSLIDLLKDTARWGAFLSAFSGVYVSADEAIACLGGVKRTAAWRALAAGALAGPTLLLTGAGVTHTSLALYVLVRGVTLLVRCGNLPTAAPWKRRLLAPTRWRHGDTALVCLSTMQFGFSWIVRPETLPPSFVRFLNKHGGKDLSIIEAIREMCFRTAAGGPAAAAAAPLAPLVGTPHEHFQGHVPCEILHPGLSCNAHTAAFIPESYLRSIPVYLPFYVVPAALVHRRRLLQPGLRRELWTKIGLGVLRSSAFLTLYCALAWRGACAGWTLSGRTTAAGLALSCWTAGLATLIEKKSRRMELGLYCLSRALEAFALTAVAEGWVSPNAAPRRLDVLMFSVATAAICHCYSDHYGERRDVFRSKYLAVFDFILGNTGFGEGEGGITHAPSNVELFALAGQRLEVNAKAVMRSVRSSMGNLAALATWGEEEEAAAAKAAGEAEAEVQKAGEWNSGVEEVPDGPVEGGKSGEAAGGGGDGDSGSELASPRAWPSARSFLPDSEEEGEGGRKGVE
jgi:hypothetical protein